MSRQLVPCTHCHGLGWVKFRSDGDRRIRDPVNGQRFETSAAVLATRLGPNGFRPASNGFSSRPIDQGFDPELAGVLSPGESRRSTLYHQWSAGDVWVSLLLAGVSGSLIGLSSIPVCMAFKTRWYVPPIIWLGATTIVWGLKAIDFFKDDKAVISSQQQERVSEPAPLAPAALPAVEIVVQDGKTQKRARLCAPRTNHAGLWQYADALIRETAAPSYEGGDHVLGAKAFGYTPAEFDGRSDCWRPTAIAGGILEKDPHKSKGYRVTEVGKRALAVVVKRRLGEWG